MKAEKFNYTATETMHYHCPCCAAEWQTNKLPYCPNCEVKIQYASQSEPNTVTGEQIGNASRERAKAFFTPEDDLEMWDLGFHHGAKWALQQTQAVGVSELDRFKSDLLHQARRVRNYSGPEEVYYAVPVRFIKEDSELLNQKK